MAMLRSNPVSRILFDFSRSLSPVKFASAFFGCMSWQIAMYALFPKFFTREDMPEFRRVLLDKATCRYFLWSLNAHRGNEGEKRPGHPRCRAFSVKRAHAPLKPRCPGEHPKSGYPEHKFILMASCHRRRLSFGQNPGSSGEFVSGPQPEKIAMPTFEPKADR